MLAYSRDVCFHLSPHDIRTFPLFSQRCAATVSQVLYKLSSVQQCWSLLFVCVVVFCVLLSLDFSASHLKLAAAGSFPPPPPPPPPPCFFFSWQLCQGPHIEEEERNCCTILVDRLTYISQRTIYFCSIIIYLPARQSRGKQGCAEACARKVQGPTPRYSIPLEAHSSHSVRPHHVSLLGRGLPLGPPPESQSRAQPQMTGLGTRAAGRGPLSTTEPQQYTGIKYCFRGKTTDYICDPAHTVFLLIYSRFTAALEWSFLTTQNWSVGMRLFRCTF